MSLCVCNGKVLPTLPAIQAATQSNPVSLKNVDSRSLLPHYAKTCLPYIHQTFATHPRPCDALLLASSYLRPPFPVPFVLTLCMFLPPSPSSPSSPLIPHIPELYKPIHFLLTRSQYDTLQFLFQVNPHKIHFPNLTSPFGLFVANPFPP